MSPALGFLLMLDSSLLSCQTARVWCIAESANGECQCGRELWQEEVGRVRLTSPRLCRAKPDRTLDEEREEGRRVKVE